MYSCNYFENKKIHVNDEMVEEKLRKIDKTQVDKYPIFNDCESINGDIEAEKNCFITTLSNHITNYLIQQNLILEEEFESAFELLVEVDKNGALLIKSYTIDNHTKEIIPNIETLISDSLSSLPKIYPAIKKLPSADDNVGELVPVTTQFIIPIKIIAVSE